MTLVYWNKHTLPQLSIQYNMKHFVLPENKYAIQANLYRLTILEEQVTRKFLKTAAKQWNVLRNNENDISTVFIISSDKKLKINQIIAYDFHEVLETFNF